eukprot:123008-Chlamydomonas_euryale.AAC.3
MPSRCSPTPAGMPTRHTRLHLQAIPCRHTPASHLQAMPMRVTPPHTHTNTPPRRRHTCRSYTDTWQGSASTAARSDARHSSIVSCGSPLIRSRLQLRAPAARTAATAACTSATWCDRPHACRCACSVGGWASWE